MYVHVIGIDINLKKKKYIRYIYIHNFMETYDQNSKTAYADR